MAMFARMASCKFEMRSICELFDDVPIPSTYLSLTAGWRRA